MKSVEVQPIGEAIQTHSFTVSGSIQLSHTQNIEVSGVTINANVFHQVDDGSTVISLSAADGAVLEGGGNIKENEFGVYIYRVGSSLTGFHPTLDFLMLTCNLAPRAITAV